MIRSKDFSEFYTDSVYHICNYPFYSFNYVFLYGGKYTDKKRIFIFPGKIQLGSLCLHLEKCV